MQYPQPQKTKEKTAVWNLHRKPSDAQMDFLRFSKCKLSSRPLTRQRKIYMMGKRGNWLPPPPHCTNLWGGHVTFVQWTTLLVHSTRVWCITKFTGVFTDLHVKSMYLYMMPLWRQKDNYLTVLKKKNLFIYIPYRRIQYIYIQYIYT